MAAVTSSVVVPLPRVAAPTRPILRTLTLVSARRQPFVALAARAGGDNSAEDGRAKLPPPPLRWQDLLRPDAENAAAVVLAGVLAWAGAQVLLQLLFISLAIVVAAVKYSFIAALLLALLITLL